MSASTALYRRRGSRYYKAGMPSYTIKVWLHLFQSLEYVPIIQFLNICLSQFWNSLIRTFQKTKKGKQDNDRPILILMIYWPFLVFVTRKNEGTLFFKISKFQIHHILETPLPFLLYPIRRTVRDVLLQKYQIPHLQST